MCRDWRLGILESLIQHTGCKAGRGGGSAGVSGDDRFMSGKADETKPETGGDPERLRSKYSN